MPIVIGLGDTAWNDPLNIFGGKTTAPEPSAPAAEAGKTRFTLSDQDRQDLRKTIAAEAAGEGETGMIAVGNVIRNRAERRGKSLADVVREPKQFTGYEQPGDGALQILQDPDQVAKIDGIIDRLASGELPDITDGADHYHTKAVSPDWAGKMRKTTEVGEHLFYRAEDGPDTRSKPVPSYDELASQIGLDGDPFEAVLKGETVLATERKPKGRGMADLLPEEPEPMKGNGGALSFVNPGQDKIAPDFRSVLEGASQDVGRGLTVLSGYRAPTHAVERAKKTPGEHADGTASDISMKGMNEQERATLVQSLLSRGAKRFITYSNSPDMLHVDMKDQLGDGTPWFMHDKTNRNLSKAPAWFQQIAKNPTPAQKAIDAQAPAGAGTTAAPAGNTIVIDETFAANDPMGLMNGENPFAGIVDQAKAKRQAEQTQVADQFEQNRIRAFNEANNNQVDAQRSALETESPGRYIEMDAAELPQFQQKWEEENRSGGVLGDTARILKSGAIGVGQSLTSLADTIFGNLPGGEAFLKASDDIDRWAMGQTLDQRMDTAKAQTNASVTKEQAEADTKNWWDSERGTFGPAWRDPRSYLRTVGESVPATVVTMAPGGIMARGAYLRTLAATGSERAAAAAAAKTATVAGALLEGTMGGADTARAVRDRIGEIPREELLQTDTVKALMDGGMSEEEALTALTTDASTKAFAIAGVATGMFGGLGDRALAKILAEGVSGGIAQRMLAGGARGMVAEGLLEEAPQGVAQTVAGNIGVRDANPDQDLTEGVGEAVASGIAGGGVMGGGMGAAGGAASRQTAPPAAAGTPVSAPPPAAAAPTPAPAPEPRGPIGRSVRYADQQIAERGTAAPADVIPAPVKTSAPAADAAPATSRRPQVGATVRIDADGIEPFMGRVDGYEGDDAVIVDSGSGEIYQIPIGNLTEIAKPMETIPDRGPEPINDAIPEFSTDPALEPMAPVGAEVRSEGLPPRSEQKEATERFPSAPTAGQRVIVDDENGGRFVATVQGYENGGTEALIRTEDGKDLQVPVSSLKVSKLTEKQVEAQELKRNPPVEREVADAGPTSRTLLGKTIVMPDDKHARLFDLGKERQSSRRVMGTSQLELDKVDPRELKALANEFGISEQAVGQLADDYATRMVRNVRSANSKLPQRMPPVMDNILARWRREVVDADTSPAADETQAWYDRELDDEGRRLAMISANIKRPPKTPWADLSPAMRKKLATVREEQLEAAAPPADVDSTEANSVESDVGAPVGKVAPKATEQVEAPRLPQVVYHGTSNGKFSTFDTYAGKYGLFGSGGYFTESSDIAREYTQKGSGTAPTIYAASLNVKNALDMDAAADLAAWQEAFADIVDTLDLPAGATNEQVYRVIEETLAGEMIPDYEGAEIMQNGVRAMGHDAITHIGGGRHKASKGTKHRVWIVFDPDQVSDLRAVEEPGADGASRSPPRKRPTLLERYANYFRPGRIVESYGGGRDEVVSFNPGDGDRWSVTVVGLSSDGTRGRQRTHSTEPSAAKLDQWEKQNPVGEPTPQQASVDKAAHEAATSPKNDLPEPTPAQKEAGNYKVGRITLGGLDISIENPAGSERKGTDKDGKAWSVTMKSHYGYIRGTKGSDGDHIDVFIKPGTETLDADSPVFIVDQENPDGSFDEHKVMLGFETQDEAEKAYLENYTKGWKIGPVTATKLRGFKDWLNRGYTDEPASIDVNEVFWNPPPPEDFLDEYGEGRLPPETKQQIYDDLATRISVPKFVERLATDKGGMGAAFIDPSGKLYLIRGTDNQNGDHAEFFGRMFANDHIPERDAGYVRISSYSDYFGYSTGGDISQAAAATIKALETAAARAGINVIKPANDFKVVGETLAVEKSKASATPKPKSLTEFLAERGGVQDQGGDLRVAGVRPGKESFVPGAGSLIRSNGMTLDQARKVALEAGYLTDAGAGTNRPSESYISDLIDAIAEDVRSGRQLFSKADAAQAARWMEEQQLKQDLDRYGSEQEFRTQQAMESALDEVTALTGRERTDVFAIDIASVMVEKGVDFDTAAIEIDRRYEEQALAAARNAEPQIIGALKDIPFFDEDGGAAGAARTVDNGTNAGRAKAQDDAGPVRESGTRAAGSGEQRSGSEAQDGSDGSVAGVSESGRIQENDGRRQQKARKPELTPGRSTTRTVAGKSVVFPDEYHAEVFDLGMVLLGDNGLSPADIRAGTSIDEVIPENFRVLGPRREEAQRLASTIGTYMDPTILSADEMGLAAMEIAVMETEVAVSKRGDTTVKASSVIDVDAQQEWAQAVLDEVRRNVPVQPRAEGEVLIEKPPVGEQRESAAAPQVLQPRPDKRDDPDPIIAADPGFRRIPVPDRQPDQPIFAWARDAVLERGMKSGNEHLMAIDDDGTVVEFGTSDKPKFVGLNARLSKAAANPDRRLVFIHNHPENWPLSIGDIAMLANPGAFSIWAIGHNGRETRASLTDGAQTALRLGTSAEDVTASINRLEKALRDAEKGLEAIIGAKIADKTVTVPEAEEAHFNAILEAARRAGIIAFTTNQPYDHSNIPMLDRAIDNAALKLARTLLNERAAPQTSDAGLLRQAVSVQHVGELETVAGDGGNVEGRDEGQGGLREGGPADYQAEAQGRVTRRLTGSRRISENSIVEAISGKWTDLNPTVLATVPLNYFVELARPNMTAVKEYMSVKRLMDAYRGDKHAEADAIAGDWLKYMRLGFGKNNKAKAQELADLMHESTLAGIDPSQTDDETKAKAGYDILRKRYQALAPAGKELFGKVRDAYRAQADELDQILLDNVRKSQQIAKDQAEARYRKKLEEIRDAKMNPIDRRKAEEDAASRYKSESTKMDWSAKARLTKLRIQFESNRVPAPYFPLGRFGQYYVTAKDVDGSVISFSKFERAADRDRFARDIQRDYPGAAITKGVMKEMSDPRAAMDPRMVAEIEQLLGNAGVDQDLMDMVYQRYLETLPELSMRKRYMHRKGTAGFDTDALRVFSSHMFHAAHQMAKLKYGLELQELVNTTFDQAEEADDQTRAMRLANEMASRHKWVMNPTGGSLAQTMTSTAFVWFLAASPAAAVLNLTQTFMMGLPILGARFGGITGAAVEVAKASADLISGKGSVRNANLSREEMAAVDAFYRSGMIDRTQSHDLAGVGDTGVKYSPLRARVMGVMSWAFHNTEVWNREATALAAYRLGRKSGQSHLDAIDSAHDLTWKTHFDYSNSSRPRIMQNDFAKVALVFRSYSINMLYRMFRDIHQSVKGESPQARREARYQLAGVTGMMTLMAGVTGTFGFNLMMAVAGMVFGDDDDPMDFEERFKADVLDILGPELGGVVLKGVPGHYLGVDLTSRIGMPDLWFRSPGQDLQGKEEWQYWTTQMLGATAGIGEQWFRGASLIMEGDVARGVEIAAPKFIRDPMKAFRYANEGLQSIKGDELLPADQIGIHGAVAQAMGISPAVVSETWERSGALKNAERRVMDERQRVVNAWAMAAIEGDKEGVAEAIERVKAFNKKPVHSAIPITQDTLKRSIKTRVRNAAKREDGVLIQNEILSQRLRAAMPQRLY